ncbi:MAG: SDR family oxidoreductase [Pseudomonadota bacterium]
MRHLALECAPYNISVNAIAPGWFVTELTDNYFCDEKNKDIAHSIISRVPLKRVGQVKELLGATLLLISNAGKYITGEVLRVDGGLAINDV